MTLFRLTYPTATRPRYVLTHPKGEWSFAYKRPALDAYNAGLLYENLLHRYEHPDEWHIHRMDREDPLILQLGRAWLSFTELAVRPYMKPVLWARRARGAE